MSNEMAMPRSMRHTVKRTVPDRIDVGSTGRKDVAEKPYPFVLLRRLTMILSSVAGVCLSSGNTSADLGCFVGNPPECKLPLFTGCPNVCESPVFVSSADFSRMASNLRGRNIFATLPDGTARLTKRELSGEIILIIQPISGPAELRSIRP